jgi:PKD domain
MFRKLQSRRSLFLVGLGVVLVAALAVIAVAALGGDDNGKSASKSALEDPNPDNHEFHVFADASPFAQGAPMTVDFRADKYNASGDVKYYWRFDDGTTSTEQNPTHTFEEPGTYSVLMDGRDSEGHRDRYTLILGAWPKSVWETSEQRNLTQTEQLNAIAAQSKRTAARRKKLRDQGKGTLDLDPGAVSGQ